MNDLRIKFDGNIKPDIISMEPDENVDSVDWMMVENDWVLVIRFNEPELDEGSMRQLVIDHYGLKENGND